jgi:hypothetical protein
MSNTSSLFKSTSNLLGVVLASLRSSLDEYMNLEHKREHQRKTLTKILKQNLTEHF